MNCELDGSEQKSNKKVTNYENFSVTLDKKQGFYLGRISRSPVEIDLIDGVTFLIFLSEEGYEELQICELRGKSQSWLEIKEDQITCGLHKLFDKDNNPFFIAKIQADEVIAFKESVTFMVFVSREGEEKLQISCGPRNPRKSKENKFEKEFLAIEEKELPIAANKSDYYISRVISPDYVHNITFTTSQNSNRIAEEITQKK